MHRLQRSARLRHVLAELHQVQHAPSVDRVTLRRGRKHLLEACKLEVIDVQQPPTALADQGVERSRMAVVAFHRDRGHGAGEAPVMPLDAAEEVLEAFRAVIDVERFEQLTAGQADGNAVASAADVHGNVKLGRNNHGGLRR